MVPTGKSSKDIAVSSEFFRLNPGLEKFKFTLTVTTPSGARGKGIKDLT